MPTTVSVKKVYENLRFFGESEVVHEVFSKGSKLKNVKGVFASIQTHKSMLDNLILN